jgi:hypothetical protein
MEFGPIRTELLRMRKILGLLFLSDLVEISRVASENIFFLMIFLLKYAIILSPVKEYTDFSQVN